MEENLISKVKGLGQGSRFGLRVMENGKKPIKSFRDLEVYNVAYEGMLKVYREVFPFLPEAEKYDLKDQLGRSTKAPPRLIAEGYAKRHQKAGFQKYLDDAMGECNETIVGLEQACDLYGAPKELIEELVALYDRLGRQIYRLREAWNNFKTQTS